MIEFEEPPFWTLPTCAAVAGVVLGFAAFVALVVVLGLHIAEAGQAARRQCACEEQP